MKKNGLSSLLTKLRKSGSSRDSRPSQLRLENLEDRQLLSVTDIAALAAADSVAESAQVSTVTVSSDDIVDVQTALNTTAAAHNADDVAALGNLGLAWYEGAFGETWNDVTGRLTGLTFENYYPLSTSSLPTSFDFSAFTALVSLNVSGFAGRIEKDAISLVGLPSTLQNLFCADNGLTSLPLGSCASLRNLDCSSNSISALSLDGKSALVSANIANNNLSDDSVSFDGLTSLETLSLYGNNFEKIDVSDSASLSKLNVYNSGLSEILVNHSTRNLQVSLYGNGLSPVVTSATGANVAVTSVDGRPTFTLDSSVRDAVTVDVAGQTITINPQISLAETSATVYTTDTNVALTVVNAADAVTAFTVTLRPTGENPVDVSGNVDVINGSLTYVGGFADGEYDLYVADQDLLNAVVFTLTVEKPTLVAPTGLTVVSADAESITVSWDAVAGATGYVVALDAAQSTTSETSYTFTGLTASTQYGFSVYATSPDANDSAATSLIVATDMAQLATPTNLAYESTADSVTVTWDAVAGAELYAVLLSNGQQDTTAATSYTFANLDANTEYEFTVQATGSGVYASDAATLVVATDLAQLATPTNLAYESTSDSVTVTWDAVAGAEFYAVLLSNGQQDTTAATSYTFANLDADTEYEFTVQATASGAYASEAASLFVATDLAQLATPTNLAYESTSDSVTVTWDAVAGAELYAVLLSNGQQDTTAATSYTFANLDADTEYEFTVQATASGAYASDAATLVVATEAEAVETSLELNVVVDTYTNQVTPIVVANVVAVGLDEAEYAVTVNDEATDAFALNDGALTYLGGLELGDYVVAVTATQNDESFSVNMSFSVKEVSEIPSITLSSTQPEVGVRISTSLNPVDSRARFQWYRGSDETGWTAISGATYSYFSPSIAYIGTCLKVEATYTRGEFAGQTVSQQTEPVWRSVGTIHIYDVGTIEVGTKLASYNVPASATKTYQWYRASDLDGEWIAISGATKSTYTATVADRSCYLKVVATGTGNYVGTTEAITTSPVQFDPLTLSTDSPVYGERISAVLSTAADSATFEWYYGSEESGWTLVPRTTVSYYTPLFGQVGSQLKVVAKYYRGELKGDVYEEISDNIVVAKLSRVTLGETVPYVGYVYNAYVSAGTYVLPTATSLYQWYRVSADGDETEIVGANSRYYEVSAEDLGSFLKVVATGVSPYVGTVESTTSHAVVAVNPLSVSTEDPVVGETVTATLTPADEAATYQWYRYDNGWRAIEGETNPTYTVLLSDLGKDLRIAATYHSGEYAGATVSETLEPVVKRIDGFVLNDDEGYGIGATLIAVDTQADDQVEYQWYKADSLDGEWIAVDGATESSYTLVEGDRGQYVKVVVNGVDLYIGTVELVGQEAVGLAGELTLSNYVPTVGGQIRSRLNPVDVYAKYQWYAGSDEDGWNAISGAKYSYFSPSIAYLGKYLKVEATYVRGELAGSKYEAVTNAPVTRGVSAVTLTTSTSQVGKKISVYTTPVNATVAYQWYRVDGEGAETAIDGATKASYVPTVEDAGYALKIVATGTGYYTGSAEATTSEITLSTSAEDELFDDTQVAFSLLTEGVAELTLTEYDPTVGGRVCAHLDPVDSFAKYQWYAGSDEEGWTAIDGAKYNYFSPSIVYLGKDLKVEATYVRGENAGETLTAQTSEVRIKVASLTINEPEQLNVGTELTLKTSPKKTECEFQWYRVDASGNETLIEGATDAKYTTTQEDGQCKIKCVATGIGDYTGVAEAVTLKAVDFNPLAVSTTAPTLGGRVTTTLALDAQQATYRWFYGSDEAGWTETSIKSSYYTPSYAQIGSQLKVVATYKAGELEGRSFEAVTGIVTRGVSAVTLTTSASQVGRKIAVYTTPVNATVTYQWYRVDGEGAETAIDGATKASYVPTVEDAGYALKIVATGVGSYTGSAEATTTEITLSTSAEDELSDEDLDVLAAFILG